jgi:hypothetical protein
LVTGCELKEERGKESLNGVGGGEAKRNKSVRNHLGVAWPLIKYISRFVYIMTLITCMIVVRKCNKKFVHYH